jgi:Ni,Fe-hydrogenase III large subunit
MGLKERAMRLCALATGHRLGFDAIIPGGVGSCTLREPAAVSVALGELSADVDHYLAKLFGNTSVVSRWQHTGVVTHEIARAFAAVGPARRAIGDALDVRSFARYGAYAQRVVQPAVHAGGDAFARCSVKRAEIAASFRLVHDALCELGDAPPATAAAIAHIPKGAAIGVVEGPRGAETVVVHVDSGGRIARFHAISASYRNWPIVARAMDGNIIPDFPLVNKSFNLCYACADR